MNTLSQGIQIPLQVIYEGEPLNLDTADALRRVRSYIDARIGIYDGAEKLRQLAPSLSAPDASMDADLRPLAFPSTPQRAIDYIVVALQTLGSPLPMKAVYHHILTLGWSTNSPDLKKALRNLENTARHHKEAVSVEKGMVRLVRPG